MSEQCITSFESGGRQSVFVSETTNQRKIVKIVVMAKTIFDPSQSCFLDANPNNIQNQKKGKIPRKNATTIDGITKIMTTPKIQINIESPKKLKF